MSRRPSEKLRPLAVTIGDPAGIGVDIILKIHAERAEHQPPEFVLLGDVDYLKQRAWHLDLDVEIQSVGADWFLSGRKNGKSLPVYQLENPLSARPGVPDPQDAKAITEAISTATELVRTGKTRGIVTLPINKKSLYDSGFDYPGHTEFLAALAESWKTITGPVKPVMMLAGPELRAVPVTIHIPLSEVPGALTEADIVETARIADRELKKRFGLSRPKIAISGLNPHAGEGGAMGLEDETIIAPAVARLQKEGISCIGPLPADTMFHSAARKNYDLAVCMYHDQALIPAKALAFDDTVNVTLGLPFVRTSPDHGTALDLAGSGKAKPDSTLAALRLADTMTTPGDDTEEPV